jgi:hypothetical protein
MRDVRGSRTLYAAVALGIASFAVFVGTAVAGRSGSIERDALVRARVWCEALVARDAPRYQDTFRKGYFRPTFDRFANEYREPTEAAIRAQMPRAVSCEQKGAISDVGLRGDIYVPVTWRSRVTLRARLRMRREAGFLVVYQISDA